MQPSRKLSSQIIHIVRGFRGIDHKTAVETINLKSFFLDCAQMIAARNESDILAGLGKAPAEVATNSTSSKDCYPHLTIA